MKQITANSDFKQYWMAFPLVAGDVGAYEVVLNLGQSVSGTFQVTAKKPNGNVQFVTAAVSGSQARVTLKNTMYDVSGETELYLLVFDAVGNKITEKVIMVETEEGPDEGVISSDEVTRLDSLISQASQASANGQYAKEQGDYAKEQGDYVAEEFVSLDQKLENYVQKEDGKALSTNDYTDSEKEKVALITTSSYSGVTLGKNSSAYAGGAVGPSASVYSGGAVGQSATADMGGAAGYNAKTGDGFSGGRGARTQNSSGTAIDAVQLGTGTNTEAKTLQAYTYQLMDAEGKIPDERISTTSDRRLKEDISAADGARLLEFVSRLKVVDYKYIGDDTPRLGLVAQDIQEADEEVSRHIVLKNAKGYLEIKPEQLVFPLIAAVQELQKEIKTLKEEE